MTNSPARRNPYIKFLLLAPALLLVVGTTIYPLVSAFILSFQRWRLNRTPQPSGFVGLENYLYAFQDKFFVQSVLVTLEYTVISVVLSLVVGLAMALILQKRTRLNQFVRLFLIFPFAVSPALKGISFVFFLNQDYGIFHALISAIFPFTKDMVWLGDPFWALFWVAISEVWGWAPLYALTFIAALGSISPEIFEAAKVDGAENWDVFWKITLPLLRPVLIIAALLKTIFSLKLFDQVVTMTGGGPGRSTQTLNFYVYLTAFRNLDMGYAAALAFILFAALAIFAYFYMRTLDRPTGA